MNFIERFVVDRRRLGANCADERVRICAFMKGREIRTPELHSRVFLWHGMAFELGLRQAVREEEHMRNLGSVTRLDQSLRGSSGESWKSLAHFLTGLVSLVS